jgi:tRNA (mo5U34)-methyltransferase
VRWLRRIRGSSSELYSEFDRPPAWMYPWEIDGRRPNLLHEELPSVHETRREMIEAPVREALAEAGPGARALDLACSEGWFSHRLLEWGAESVVGIDVRSVNVRRAELVRDHLGTPADRLSFVRADVFDLRPEEIGSFDVVLMLGLVYHLEDPVGAVRVARSLTGSLCVIESQLNRQNEPIEHGWGATELTVAASGSFAVLIETDQESNPVASAGGGMSLIPNRAALEQMPRVAGFGEVEFAAARPGLNSQYVEGDRGIVLARRPTAG